MLEVFYEVAFPGGVNRCVVAESAIAGKSAPKFYFEKSAENRKLLGT